MAGWEISCTWKIMEVHSWENHRTKWVVVQQAMVDCRRVYSFFAIILDKPYLSIPGSNQKRTTVMSGELPMVQLLHDNSSWKKTGFRFPTDCRLDWNWGPLGVTGFPGFLVGWCGTLMRMRVPSRVLKRLANFQSLKAYQGPCLRSKWYHTEGCWRTIENCVTAVRHTNPLLGISWGTSYKCMFVCTSEAKLLHWEDRPGGILPVWSIGLTSTASQSQSPLQCCGWNGMMQCWSNIHPCHWDPAVALGGVWLKSHS